MSTPPLRASPSQSGNNLPSRASPLQPTSPSHAQVAPLSPTGSSAYTHTRSVSRASTISKGTVRYISQAAALPVLTDSLRRVETEDETPNRSGPGSPITPLSPSMALDITVPAPPLLRQGSYLRKPSESRSRNLSSYSIASNRSGEQFAFAGAQPHSPHAQLAAPAVLPTAPGQPGFLLPIYSLNEPVIETSRYLTDNDVTIPGVRSQSILPGPNESGPEVDVSLYPRVVEDLPSNRARNNTHQRIKRKSGGVENPNESKGDSVGAPRPLSLDALARRNLRGIGMSLDGNKIYIASGSIERTDMTGGGGRQRVRDRKANERAGLSRWGLFMYDLRNWLEKRRKKRSAIQIWMSELKRIEGRFGSGVSSYFILHRWSFLMNLFLSFLWVVFVLSIGIASMFPHYEVQVNPRHLNVTITGMTQAKWPRIAQGRNGGEVLLDIFTGDNGFKNASFFYYGYYTNEPFAAYRMDLAYIFVVCAFFITSFLGIVLTMRDHYVHSNSLTSTVALDTVHPFATVAFTGWNHGVTTPTARRNLSTAISTIMRTLVASANREHARVVRTRRDVAVMWVKRVLANVIWVWLMAASGVLIYSAIVPDGGVIALMAGRNVPELQQLTSVIVAGLNVIMPLIFVLLGQFEEYDSPGVAMTFGVLRSFLLKMASLYVVLYAFYQDFQTQSASYGSHQFTSCWENNVGQKFYQLLWLDLAITCVATIVQAFLMKKIFGRYEFDLPTNILELVYRQALIWVGTTYCPIIAILSVISSSFIFYIKYLALMVWGDPPKELYSSSGQTNGFLIFMCLTLFLSASPVWYAITMLPPSCGPHLVNAFVTPFQYTLRMWDVVPAWIDTLPTAPRWALNFAGSAALTVPILIVLLLYAYYLRAVKEKQGQKLRELEAEVKAEREDKKFLMRFYKVQT